MYEKTHPVAANDQPGSEAAESSSGHGKTAIDPTKKELEQVDEMYRSAAKKLAREGLADPKAPTSKTLTSNGDRN